MKIIFQNINHDVLFLMRRASYGYERKDSQTGELSFSKRLGANRYPRFHVYVKKDGDTMTVNLHLDQKQPSYEGATAHSGEYEGELVEQEAEMIKLAINRVVKDADETEARRIATGSKPSFFQRIFRKKS